jgi:hypothetical protein
VRPESHLTGYQSGITGSVRDILRPLDEPQTLPDALPSR